MKQKNYNLQQQEQTDSKNVLPHAQYISVSLKVVVTAGWLLPRIRCAPQTLLQATASYKTSHRPHFLAAPTSFI